MFGSRKKELRELCNEARARLAAACGEGSPYMGPALAFVSRLEACGFDSCAEMESAFECAVEACDKALKRIGDHMARPMGADAARDWANWLEGYESLLGNKVEPLRVKREERGE